MQPMELIWTMLMLKICKHTFYAYLSWFENWRNLRVLSGKVFATKILLYPERFRFSWLCGANKGTALIFNVDDENKMKMKQILFSPPSIFAVLLLTTPGNQFSINMTTFPISPDIFTIFPHKYLQIFYITPAASPASARWYLPLLGSHQACKLLVLVPD